MKFTRIDQYHSVSYLSEENYSYHNFKSMKIIVSHKAKTDKSFPNNKVSTTIYVDNDYIYVENSLIKFGGGPNKSLVTRYDKKYAQEAA